jgi:DNA topoisomerase-1
MARSLVIVESPAKAKTISRFLGDGYDVKASVGHVADLPSKGLAVDVNNGFKPTYELTTRGKEVVKELRAALKDADELYLATDEDREGEAISWHLLEALKPSVPVKRMVFHEITRSIDEAVRSPVASTTAWSARPRHGGSSTALRLRGLAVLWKKVNAGLSAGRVQSPRPARRRARVGADPLRRGGLLGHRGDAPIPVRGTLVAYEVNVSRRAATSTSGPPSGRRPGRRRGARPWPDRTTRAQRLRVGPSTRSRIVEPKAPFMTSTLQQEGGRKLNMSASQVMRRAGPVRGRLHHLHAHRLDDAVRVAVARRALQVTDLFGSQYLADKPRRWEERSRTPRRPHEAIRPAARRSDPGRATGELRL